MSSDLLASHLAVIKEYINPAKDSHAQGKSRKAKKSAPKTPKGLPHPSKKVGKKRLLTSYVDAAQHALKKSEEHLAKIIQTVPSQLKKKKKARSDALRVIKLQHERK